MTNGVYTFKEGVLENIKTGAIVLRESDANALKTGFNQSGQSININKSASIEKELGIVNQEGHSADILKKLQKLEVKDSSITVQNVELNGDGLSYHYDITSINDPAATFDL